MVLGEGELLAVQGHCEAQWGGGLGCRGLEHFYPLELWPTLALT